METVETNEQTPIEAEIPIEEMEISDFLDGDEEAAEVDETDATGTAEPQQPAEDPIQKQLAEAAATAQRAQQEAEALKNQFQQYQQSQMQRPNFVDLDMTKVNAHVAEMMDAMEALRLEGRSFEALRIQKDLDNLVGAIEENENRRQQWTVQQQQMQRNQMFTQQLNQGIGMAANMIQQRYAVPPETWTAGEKFFEQAKASDPVLRAQYEEKVYLHGPVEAVLWAFDYVKTNMPQNNPTAEVKNEAKANLAPTPSPTLPSSAKAELKKLHEKAAASGRAEDFVAYRQAKARFKRAGG